MTAQEEWLAVGKSTENTCEILCVNCEDSFFISSFLREENTALFYSACRCKS